MENTKMCPLIFALAVMSSCLMVTWCQSCGTKAYGGSPQLEFYATKLGEPSRPQDTNRFFNSVTVHRGSSITLTCTATEPLGFPSRLEPYLRPYVINWFVNSSTIQVSNCDEKPRKTKTCLLSLVNVKPRDNGKYFCQAANELGCTYKQLHLKVTDGERPDLRIGRIVSRQGNISKKFKLRAWWFFLFFLTLSFDGAFCKP